jgi:predicted O-methyltransferase YrrM
MAIIFPKVSKLKSPRDYRVFKYNRALLPNAHLSKLEEGVYNISDAREKSGLSIGYPGWGLLYYILLSHLKPGADEVIIETGANWGCTTIILAQALVDSASTGRVISVELDLENYEIAKQNLASAGLTKAVDLYQGDSRVVLSEVLPLTKKVRFAFLDASHLHEDVKQEFDLLYPSLDDDAVVIFDNTFAISEAGEDARVNGFLQSITNQYGGNLINFEFVSWFTPGLAVWQKRPNL